MGLIAIEKLSRSGELTSSSRIPPVTESHDPGKGALKGTPRAAALGGSIDKM